MLRFAALLALTLLLAGCQVPVVGSTGVGVDSQGGIVGHLAVCREHIDGATLYIDDQSGPDGEGRTVGRWQSSSPVVAAATWSLSSTSPGWSSSLPVADLQPHRAYTMYGWTHDDSSSTADVTFTSEQLQSLKPGQVLYFAGYDEKEDKDLQRIGSASDFQDFACRP